MEIIFLSGLFPKEVEEDIISNSKGSVQNAANNLQWEFVKGLEDNLQKPISIINALYIGSYPKRYKQILIQDYNFSENLSFSSAKNVGFINIFALKELSRFFGIRRELKKQLKCCNDNLVIMAYAMTATFTSILRYVKRVSPNAITCLIVPDLPAHMNMSKTNSSLYRIFKSIEIQIIKNNLKYVDSFVPLTNHMVHYLKLNKPFQVIEGIAPSEIYDNKIEEKLFELGIRTVLYTGELNERYGVIDLLNSFMLLENKNYRLIICGYGEAKDIIEEASKKDSRIIFKGLLKREEIITLQKQATVLINPRKNNEVYTKYSFPSKTIEYLSSGRPVMGYFLDGMPEEYKDYLYIIEDSVNGLYLALKDFLNKDDEELNLIGIKGKHFVLTEKNRKKQMKKVISMFNKMLKY